MTVRPITASDLVARFPALRHTGIARMHVPTLYKAAEILEHLHARLGKTLTHVWGYDPDAGNKEHHTGRALDFMTFADRTAGDVIAAYVIANAERLGLVHILWKQRIYRGPYSTSHRPKGIWQEMADRGSTTQNHFDHPHVWFTDSIYVPPPTPPKPDPTEEEILMALKIENPRTGASWPIDRALWSIWTYALRSFEAAIQARELSRAALAKADLSDAELDQIEARAKAAVTAALAEADDDTPQEPA